MKVSGGVSHSLKQAQGQMDAKNVKGNKSEQAKGKGIESALSAQVSLSKEAQQIKTATDIAKKETVDEQKVAHLQNLIDAGKYQVDAASVADKLIDDHMKMPS